jgi:hypothetical protein
MCMSEALAVPAATFHLGSMARNGPAWWPLRFDRLMLMWLMLLCGSGIL